MELGPHVIGVEFGWRLLKCVKGHNFVVWVGMEPPGLSYDFYLYKAVFVPVMNFAQGPGSFLEAALYLVLNFLPYSGLLPKHFNHVFKISNSILAL